MWKIRDNKIIKMGHLHYFALIFLLGEICFFVRGVDNFTVQFENQKTCFQENTNIKFEIEYTGAGTPDTLQWKFSKMSVATDTLNIVTAICTAANGADPAFPVTRMSYTCDNTNKKYTTTIKEFSEASDAGTWEVALSVSGVYTNFKNVTVEKCAATTPPSSEVSSTSTTTSSTTTSATSTNTSSTTLPTRVTSTSTPSTTTTAISTNTSSTPFPTGVTSTSTPSTTTSAISTTSISITSTRPTASPSSGNETTVIIVSSVVGGLFFVGIVITIVLMLLSQRKKHSSVKHSRNHRHYDQDRRQKRLYNQGYPTLQEHGQYNNTSYMEYPGMGTKMNPFYVQNRSAHRAEQNYYLYNPSTDHQIYPRNHQIYYGGNRDMRPQPNLHFYEQRNFGGKNNMIRSTLPRDENNYLTPDYELYW